MYSIFRVFYKAIGANHTQIAAYIHTIHIIFHLFSLIYFCCPIYGLSILAAFWRTHKVVWVIFVRRHFLVWRTLFIVIGGFATTFLYTTQVLSLTTIRCAICVFTISCRISISITICKQSLRKFTFSFRFFKSFLLGHFENEAFATHRHIHVCAAD